MTEEEKVVSGEAVEEGNEQDYLATIKELKEKTVSKEAYLKLKEENKQLLNSFVNGEASPAGEVETKEQASIEELKNRLNKSHNDLEYVTTALEIRNRVLEDKGTDIFANYATDNIEYELQEAKNVASVLQECVDLAEGSPEVFKAQILSRVIDTPILPKQNKNKRR